MQKREFHKTARTGKIRVWTIEVEGPLVHTSHGELDGKFQFVTDEAKAKNVGRSNETSPEENAIKMAERLILKKQREGYRPAGEAAVEQEIDWENKFIPESFRLYKPSNTLSAGMSKLTLDMKTWFSRKRDGEMLVIIKWADGEVEVRSRTMLTANHNEIGKFTLTDRFPRWKAYLEARDDIPPCSMLLGDGVADPHARDRWEFASFMKALTPDALKLLDPYFYCWDIAFWGRVPVVSEEPVEERYGLIWDVFGNSWDRLGPMLPVEVYSADDIVETFEDFEVERADVLEMAQFLAAMWKWEGWVVVDPRGVYGDRAFNFRGKTDRPGKFCGKLKPEEEDDFIAFFDPDNVKGEGKFGKWGNGNDRGLVGSVDLYQYNEHDDTLVRICACGGGITEDFQKKYSDPDCYPMVLRIRYTERTYISRGDKTNALSYPRLDTKGGADPVRHDKSLAECVNPEL